MYTHHSFFIYRLDILSKAKSSAMNGMHWCPLLIVGQEYSQSIEIDAGD